MKARFCQSLDCGKKLTGKQRLFCSNACRMRFRRSDQRLTGLDLIIGEIVRGKTGNGADFLNKRTFEVKLMVRFASDLPPGEWDLSLLADYIKRTIAQVVHKVLVYEHPDWQIEVKVEGRYTGTG